MLGLDVKAIVVDDGIAVECTQTIDSVAQWTSREFLRLKDEAVRSRLIELGWTPPPGPDWT